MTVRDLPVSKFFEESHRCSETDNIIQTLLTVMSLENSAGSSLEMAAKRLTYAYISSNFHFIHLENIGSVRLMLWTLHRRYSISELFNGALSN
jgi:hypothetical protein